MALPRASSLPEDSEFSRVRLARGPRTHACPQGHGRCGMPEKHRINSHPAHPCTKFCAGHRMAGRGPAQGAKRLQSTSAPRTAVAGRPRGRWLPRSLGMCVLAKMYYGLWGVGRRFRAVWLTLWCSPPHGGEYAVVQCLGRQNATQEGSTGCCDLAGASGEWAPGLADCLDAIFCAASYDGLVQQKLHIRR